MARDFGVRGVIAGERAQIKNMNRIGIMFAGAAVFVWFGLKGVAAQTLEEPKVDKMGVWRSTHGEKVVPQALVPCAPPVLPKPSGLIMDAPSSDQRPQAPSKTTVVNQASRVNPSRTGQQEPEQTKVAQVYRGAGYFDAALAKRLEPMLAKALGAANSAQKQLPRTSQPASGSQDSVQSKDEEETRKVTQSGGL
jgi:hypothetical protein